MARVEPPALIPIPDVTCANTVCDKPLAWRAGVARYVISHADGDDLCSRQTVRIAEADDAAAQAAFARADAEFVAAREREADRVLAALPVEPT